MSDPDTLNVWHEQRLAGQLWRNTAGAIGFRYDPEWSANGGFADRTEARAVRQGRRACGFAVSRSLPLTTGEFAPKAGIVHRFFANLLPEGGVREHIVRDLKLPNTDFDLRCTP